MYLPVNLSGNGTRSYSSLRVSCCWLFVIYIAFPRPERIAIYVELLLIIFATQVKQRI